MCFAFPFQTSDASKTDSVSGFTSTTSPLDLRIATASFWSVSFSSSHLSNFALCCELPIDLLHYLLSPLNARLDELVGSWAALWASEQVISRSHVEAGEDRSHDPNDTLTALIHQSILAHRFAFISPSELWRTGIESSVMLKLIETLYKQWTVVKDAPIPFLMCIVAVGAVEWAFLKYFHRKNEPSKESPKAESVVTNSGSPTATASSGSVVVNVHHPERSSPPRSVPVLTPQHKRTVIRKGTLQLECPVHLYPNPEVWRRGNPSSSSQNCKAALLPITYDAKDSETTYSLYQLKAHLCFTNESGGRIDVHSARWIDVRTDQQCILALGQTKELLVAVCINDEYGTFGGDDTPVMFASGTYKVSVVLVWEHGKKFTLPEFDFFVPAPSKNE